MLSTSRSAADAANPNAAAGAKGIKGWFLKQPKWLRWGLVIVLILLAPMIISVIIGLVKAIIGLIGSGVKSVKTRLSKPVPGTAKAEGDGKTDLEGK